MEFAEIKRDVLNVPSEYFIVHCISSDLAMGAGVAKQIAERYKLIKGKLREQKERCPDDFKVGRCVLWNNVLNLITKERYFHKPTYETMALALWDLRKWIEESQESPFEEAIEKIAMPHIGCGLDQLEWKKVKFLIHQILGELDVKIVVCSWPPKGVS